MFVVRVIEALVDVWLLLVKTMKQDERLTSSETVEVSVTAVPTVATSGEMVPTIGAVVSAVAVAVADAETVIITVVPRVVRPARSLQSAAAPYFPAVLNVVDAAAVVPEAAAVRVMALFVTTLALSVRSNVHTVTPTSSETAEERVTAVPTTATLGLIPPTIGAVVSAESAIAGVVVSADGTVPNVVVVGEDTVVVEVSVDVGIESACAN